MAMSDNPLIIDNFERACDDDQRKKFLNDKTRERSLLYISIMYRQPPKKLA